MKVDKEIFLGRLVDVEKASPSYRFVKGPIPLLWISAAARFPGKALHVGIAIWYLKYLTHQETVMIGHRLALELGLNKYSINRALKHMEDGGLVLVDRKKGRRPRITINKSSQI